MRGDDEQAGRGEAFIVRLAEARRMFPLPATSKWPSGVFDQRIFACPAAEVLLFAPRGADYQTSHEEDEIYFIASGSGCIRLAGEPLRFSAGDMIFVPAGLEHRFEPPLDFAAWVVFLKR